MNNNKLLKNKNFRNNQNYVNRSILIKDYLKGLIKMGIFDNFYLFLFDLIKYIKQYYFLNYKKDITIFIDYQYGVKKYYGLNFKKYLYSKGGKKDHSILIKVITLVYIIIAVLFMAPVILYSFINGNLDVFLFLLPFGFLWLIPLIIRNKNN